MILAGVQKLFSLKELFFFVLRIWLFVLIQERFYFVDNIYHASRVAYHCLKEG